MGENAPIVIMKYISLSWALTIYNFKKAINIDIKDYDTFFHTQTTMGAEATRLIVP